MKPYILLIDDYMPLRLSLSDYLSESYKVYSVANGIDALELLKNLDINIIILDIMLPFPLDGFSILRILKNDKNLASIPVIIISALDQEDKILFGLENGANDYIVKPFSDKQLKYKINNLLSIKKGIVKDLETKDFQEKYTLNELPDIFEINFKKRFDNIIENHLTENNHTVSEIAEKMSTSVASLERWVKKIYGVSPKKYILNFKLRKAEIMLRQKMGSVKDVSYALGFNSVSYFCTRFKQQYKKTPRSYIQ